MMRLYIEGREVDLTQDEPLLITREIADIREPEKRSSDWSKTFRIPGTSNNNRVFGHIFDIAQEQLNTGTQFAPDFNPNKKAAALITVDDVEQVRGFVRLLNIAIVRGGEIEYEVSVHGVAADFFAKIRNKRMSEIDLSDLNHTLTKTAIKDSWSHDWADGYVYPMIDRGRDQMPYNAWEVADFLPAVFAKRVVDDIFTSAGYAYTSDSFFNSDEFKGRVIPMPGNGQLTEAQVAGRQATAETSGNVNYTDGQTVVWHNEINDPGANYNNTTGVYTAPNGGVYSVSCTIDVGVTGYSNVTHPYLGIDFDVYVNGAKQARGGGWIFPNQAIAGVNGTITWKAGEFKVANGATIDVRVAGVYSIQSTFARSGTKLTGGTFTVKAGSVISIDAKANGWGLNYPVDLNSMFGAGEWTQDAFMLDLIRLDNLYIEQTDKTNVLHIAPRDSFYRDTVVHDITRIIDRSQPFEIIPMGELDGNPYVFTYAVGKDIDSKEYNDITGRAYGEARIKVDNEFVTQEKRITTTFASTPYVPGGGSFRIASMVSEQRDTAELRLLYWSGKVGTEQWVLCDDTSGFANSYTNAEIISDGYPHAGHLDNPFTPTKDLCFGMPQYVNLPGGVSYPNNNLYNRNWRKYINEITDRNSKLVRVRVYVTPAEWYKWSFRDLYFFDGQYFRLNKITDYPIGGSDVVACEFLKLKTANVFTPQTGQTGGGYDAKDDNNDRWPNLLIGFNVPPRRFSYGGLAGSQTKNWRSIMNLTRGLNDIGQADMGTVTTGEKFRPAIEWSGEDWNIVLIQES